MATAVALQAAGQVPALLNYQGRVLVSGNAFGGTGQFKFVLVSADGAQTYWVNSVVGSGGQPGTSVAVAVNGGLFSVSLGDTNLPGMAALPVSVFTNPAVRLRVWFSDGTHGFQQLTPDQPIGSSAYAMMAANVPDGAITSVKLSPDAASALTAALSAQVAGLSAQVTALAGQLVAVSNQVSAAVPSGLTATSTDPADATLQGLGFQMFTSLAAPGWTTSSAGGGPEAASGQAGVWTGQQLLVWGGNLGAAIDSNSGAGYQPEVDVWQAMSMTNAPTAREQHTAVWSGQEMIVWGGVGGGAYLGSGGRFNPSNQVWTAVTTNGAPAGRVGHVAVWTGSRMVIWGGRNSIGVLGDGAAYDPVADQWTTLSTINEPSPRFGATAVWTGGTRVLVWGGQGAQGELNTGAQLALTASGVPLFWLVMNAANAPAARSAHTAVWTGGQMLVWGGQGGGNFLGDGGAFDLAAGTWTAINTTNGPAARSAHAAVWSGQEMLIFGGEAYLGTLADGAAYDPVAGQWRPLSGTGAPQARSSATAAWSGSALLVFGGVADGTPVPFLQSLNPQPTWYLYRKP